MTHTERDPHKKTLTEGHSHIERHIRTNTHRERHTDKHRKIRKDR